MKIHHLLILSLIAILSAGRMTVSTSGNYTFNTKLARRLVFRHPSGKLKSSIFYQLLYWCG